MNPIGIQVLSDNISKYLFPKVRKVVQDKIQLSKKHLQDFNLLNKTLPPQRELVGLEKILESLQTSKGIKDFFRILGEEQAYSARKRVLDLSRTEIPAIPKEFKIEKGWVRYTPEKIEKVDYPKEDSLIFDTEVLWKKSNFPVMGAAVSQKAWYVWLSPEFFKDSSTLKDKEKLIPFGSEEKVVVGHHVAFDRVRILEEYGFNPSKLDFLDTMSLHVTIGGLSSQQRGSWLKYKKEKESKNLDSLKDPMNVKETPKNWKDVGAPNNLQDIYKLYKGEYIDKNTRSEFDATDISTISAPETLQRLINYCAQDVKATHSLLQILLPKFLQKCPHPVSFAGILHMGKGYLTVTKDWNQFITDAEKKCNEFQTLIENRLTNLAVKALNSNPDDQASDQWLKYLDWEIKKPRKKDPLEFDSSFPPTERAQIALAPKWYKDLWDPKLKRIRITTSKRVSPYLLKLEWKGYPICFSSFYGWMYKVPASKDKKYQAEPLVFDEDEDSILYDPVASHDHDHVYFRVPHPEGEGKNCGNPLSKNYLSAFEDGTLSSAYPDAKEILKLNAQCSYWVSARQRIKDQFVVWNDSEKSLIGNISAPDGSPVGVILPQSVTMGTVTRRAVEATWMTAANAKENRIGSELKSLIKAPNGYRFVGADVDSQELWIASLLGDAQFGIHGASAIGFMTLQGTKHLKTDLHSVTGSIIGVSRDSAKVFNYSRIYGAGRMHACQLLLKNNPSMDRKEADRKVLQLYKQTKGQKYTVRTRTVPRGIPSQFWHGGSESFMFNAMEKIANASNPKTPVLGCEIPDSLLPKYVGTNNVAFFSSIDVDHVLRKEIDIPCVTPSNQVPISNGESLDIYQILDHFSNQDLSKVFGEELDSVKRLLDQDLEYREEPAPNNDYGTKWIEVQMARSRYDLDQALSPSVSRRGFLENTQIRSLNSKSDKL